MRVRLQHMGRGLNDKNVQWCLKIVILCCRTMNMKPLVPRHAHLMMTLSEILFLTFQISKGAVHFE